MPHDYRRGENETWSNLQTAVSQAAMDTVNMPDGSPRDYATAAPDTQGEWESITRDRRGFLVRYT